MNGWLTVAVSLIGAILGGGGAAAIVSAIARRKVTNVEVTERLNETALEFATALKADAADARREAADARREMSEMRREMATVRHEAEQLASEMRRWRAAILDPFATLDSLRAMVGHGPGNGVSRLPTSPG